MIIRPADRTQSVQEYYFSRKNKDLASIALHRKAVGLPPVINLGVGAPDGMPPKEAIEALCRTARKQDTHKYQSYTGSPELRSAIASWYGRFYGVTLDPETEIQPLVGSKEGILLLCLAFLNPGDKVLVPDPGYPTYSSAARLAGAEIVTYDLRPENGWEPDFGTLEGMDLTGVKMMWTNYPGMPTGAPASHDLYCRIVDFARRHSILVANDNPYSFILTEQQTSILSVDGAKECCVELNSLSKAHNMSGWRIGMILGAQDYIREFLKVKSQMDSGMFRGLQDAAVAALSRGEDWFRELNAEYSRRKEVACSIFDALGADYNPSSCGLFLFGRLSSGHPLASVPDAKKSDAVYEAGFEAMPLGEKVSEKILHDAGVFITPGYIFGKNGSDYIRISLCAPVPVLEQALDRIKVICG